MLFKKKEKKNISAGKRAEYEREYDEEIEKNEEQGLVEQGGEESVLHPDYLSTELIDRMGVSEDLLGLLRNSFFVNSSDSCRDFEIAKLSKDQMFDRLLELKNIYGAGEYIRHLMKEVYGIDCRNTQGYASNAKASENGKMETVTLEEEEPEVSEEENSDGSVQESVWLEGGEIVSHESEINGEYMNDEGTYDSADDEYEEYAQDDCTNYVLKVVDYQGEEKKYLLSELTEDENMELLEMLTEANCDHHIQDFAGYLESLGAVITDGSEYEDDEVYMIYDAISNEILNEEELILE